MRLIENPFDSDTKKYNYNKSIKCQSLLLKILHRLNTTYIYKMEGILSSSIGVFYNFYSVFGIYYKIRRFTKNTYMSYTKNRTHNNSQKFNFLKTLIQ